MRTIPTLIALLLSLALAGSARAQPVSTAHLLLGSDYGEFCTMCEAFVLCQRGPAPETAPATLPSTGDFHLYYFPTRTFWQQIATIWEWFAAMFVPQNTHDRPLTTYQRADGSLKVSTRMTTFSVAPPTIDTGEHIIDRGDSKWLNRAGDTIGHCSRLPLWETLDAVAELNPATEDSLDD